MSANDLVAKYLQGFKPINPCGEIVLPYHYHPVMKRRIGTIVQKLCCICGRSFNSENTYSRYACNRSACMTAQLPIPTQCLGLAPEHRWNKTK